MKRLSDVARKFGCVATCMLISSFLFFPSDPQGAEETCNICLTLVREWLRTNALKLTPEETQVLGDGIVTCVS